MNSADLAARLKARVGQDFDGVCALAEHEAIEIADCIEALETWKAEAMEVLREFAAAARAIGSDDAVVRFYTEKGYREINYAVLEAARRLVEKEDGR